MALMAATEGVTTICGSFGDYELDESRDRLDVPVIHGFLRGSYWAKGIDREVVERSLEYSDCFGLYHGVDQVGFARVISDRATFAYLCDVFVIPEHRGRGLGKWMISRILSLDRYRGFRRWLLATLDAHSLYAGVGFRSLVSPERFMEIFDPHVYLTEP
jgi:GNAT superfamily N-acetyltransferase